MKANYSIHIEKKLLDKLRVKAVEKGTTVAEIIRKLIKDYLK